MLQQFLLKGLYPPRNLPVTCSLVVLPLATRTMWKPVSPHMGRKTRDMMHITIIETIGTTYSKTGGNGGRLMVESSHLCQLVLVVEDVNEAEDEYPDHVNGE